MISSSLITSELSSARELRIAGTYDAGAETGLSFSYHDGKQCSHASAGAAFQESAGIVLPLCSQGFTMHLGTVFAERREKSAFSCSTLGTSVHGSSQGVRGGVLGSQSSSGGYSASAGEGSGNSPDSLSTSPALSFRGVISNARKEGQEAEEVASSRVAPVTALSFTCPECSAPAERFVYRENGCSFPALRCSKLCGWWA